MAENRDPLRARKGFPPFHRESRAGSQAKPAVTIWSYCADFRFFSIFSHATTFPCKFFSTSPQPPHYAACASLARLKTSAGAAFRLGQGAKKSVKVFKARSRRRILDACSERYWKRHHAVLSGARKTAKTWEDTGCDGPCRRPTRQGRKPIIAQPPRLYR